MIVPIPHREWAPVIIWKSTGWGGSTRDGRDRWERVVDGDCYSTGKPWYHDQVGMSLHPTIPMEAPLSRKAKLDSVIWIRGDQEFPG
jgi:hypothetical protein